MAFRYSLIVLLLVTGCATQHKPNYEAVTNFTPDCANKDAQIRYLNKLRRFPAQWDDDERLYNKTIDIQLQRLNWYCV